MRRLSYRNRLRLKRFLKTVLLAAVILFVLCAIALIYLQRYVVYSADGAHLDFSRSTEQISSQSTLPEEKPTNSSLGDVEVVYDDESGTVNGKLKQLHGYYITAEMLHNNAALVLETLQTLDNTSAIMLDMKDRSGTFYYSTNIAGATTGSVDIETMDSIIAYLSRNGFTMIARIPSFADSAFALEHREHALCIEGGALWVDEAKYYWLDPGSSTTLSYLEQICKELSSLGFREVVFNNFTYPASGNIVYTSNLTRAEQIEAAAKEIENAFTGSNLTISFCTSDTAFPVDAASGRIFVPDASGANVDKIIASMANTVKDPNTQVVFLSESRDTRFDAYGTLRPLLSTAKIGSVSLP